MATTSAFITSIAGAADHLCAMESMASPCAHRIRQPCGETHHPSLTGKREHFIETAVTHVIVSQESSAISPSAPL